MKFNTLLLDINKSVATVTLNRPEIHNAFNDVLIRELHEVFTFLRDNNNIRAIILTGNGKSFCAGADLNWMKSVKDYTFEQNYEDSKRLSEMMHLLFTHPKPIIARINGSAIGGGVGLLSVCDICIADETAKFGLSEVRLGLIPAVISPYVISRIGPAKAREFFITGERINADKALEIGLLNKIASADKLDEFINEKINFILVSGRNAIKWVKDMIFQVSQQVFPEIQEYNINLIAKLRHSDEGQEGMNAFLEKRKPRWGENYEL